jgi:site-specific DNA-cytosine methylase
MTGWNDNAHRSKLFMAEWDQPSYAVTSARGPYSGASAVSDPRPAWQNRHSSHLSVEAWDEPAGTITGGGKGPQGGALSVADPRPPALARGRGPDFQNAGNYGVVPWTDPSYAVTGHGQHDNGRNSVADPRLPALDDKLSCVILAEDGTWHRPFTTLDMAALQSLLDPEEYMHFKLHGSSDSAWRERIGNAVPSDAAAAIGSEIARTLLLSWSGETFILSNEPIWVRQQIAAIQCGATS